MIKKSKLSQQLGAAPPDPCIWDLLIGIGTPPEKFLPTPLLLPAQVMLIVEFSRQSSHQKEPINTQKHYSFVNALLY